MTRKSIILFGMGIVTLALVAALAVTLLAQPTADASIANQPAAQATPNAANQPQAQATPSPAPAGKSGVKPNGDALQAAFLKNFATRLGVDEAKFNSAFSQALADTVDQAVKDGQLPADLATRLKTAAQSGPKDMLVVIDLFKAAGGGGPVEKFPGQNDLNDHALQAAVTALGMTPEDFKKEYGSGKSIADLAAQQHVDLQKVKDAMLSSIKTDLAALVQSGKLTQAEADGYNQTAPGWVDKFVNGKPSDARPSGSGPDMTNPKELLIGSLNDVATLLKMDVKTLMAKWESASLAAIAQTQNVDAAKLKETVLNSFKQQADAAVKAGKLTQAQADEVVKEASSHADDFINSVPGPNGSREKGK